MRIRIVKDCIVQNTLRLAGEVLDLRDDLAGGLVSTAYAVDVNAIPEPVNATPEPVAVEPDYKAMTVAELRTIAKALGISIHGKKKAELVEAIRAVE